VARRTKELVDRFGGRIATESPRLPKKEAGGQAIQFWLRGERKRAVVFGTAALVFMLCFGTHAFLVDTSRLDSPYLSTYGFLALVGLTSYDLAGEVIHTGELRSKLAQRESDLRTAVADERNRIAGELHDSVTQTLFSTAAIADALPEVWRRRPAEAANDLFVDHTGRLACRSG